MLGKKDATGFEEPLAIKGVERKGTENEQKELKIGEIEFRQSKLVGGSLQAVAKLTYFDDAIATFSLAVSQVDDTLAVAGTIDITGLSEFHVDELFSTFEISLLHLETTYIKQNDSRSWHSEGAMTGKIKFLPAKGRSASEMGALASLFDGVTVEFENLDPVKMDAEELKITFPAKRFEFASIFIVDLRGIVINPNKARGFGILGDINIQRLPGVESQFTFGGITLTPKFDENDKPIAPEFDISRIGVGLSVQGGFEIEGDLEWIENAQEIGFKGKVTIKSEALGKLDGLIKVTRIKTPDGYVPSLAIYFQKDLDVSLFAGFFLRNIGVGLGINQALNGLESKALPLPQRIITLVNDPNGLPDPELLESWVPSPPNPGQVNWMLVAAGLITLGKLPPDVEHPIAGRIILAIDQDLDIVAGVNVWLFTSPNQTQQKQFIERPVARGAIAISPKEQQVFGFFRTVKNPELTKKVPALLKEVLNKVDTSLMFVGDRNGFLLEVGWPWETKIPYDIGILRGILTSGFRFGVYRGVTSFGLNFAIDIVLNFQLGIEFSIGPLKLGAFLSISGKGYFRCSFIGALTPDFTPYLLGNVQLAATVAVQGSAYVKFSKKICRIRINKTLLNISFNINISLSAVLTAALERTNLGFQGSARIAVGVGGYSFEGNVSIEYEPKRIKPVEDKLNELLPRRVAPTSFALMQSLEIPLLALEETGPVWNYQVCRVQNQIRILLLPQPEQDYPDVFDDSESEEENNSLKTDIKKSRFQINLIDNKRFQGFLGSSSLNPDVPKQRGLELQGNQLNWRENFFEKYNTDTDTTERITISKEEIIKNSDPRDLIGNLSELKDLTLKGFLIALTSDAEQKSNSDLSNRIERIDRRTQDPLVGQTDDETTAIASKDLASPYFKGEFNQDQPDSYDNNLAQSFNVNDNTTDEDKSDGLSLGQIVAELATLIKDPKAQVKQDATAYTVAPYLNLILVFNEDTDNQENNKVEKLLDAKSFQVWDEAKAQFQTVTLEPLDDEKIEYDLIPGLTFQSQTEICLTWTFKREDDGNLSDPNNPELQRISAAYKSLDRFVVTRTILNKPNQQLVREIRPCWIKLEDSVESLLLRPQFQFVDDRLQDSGIRENDLLQYRVEAKNLGDRVLAQCLINVVRKTIKPLQAPTQSLALHKLKEALKITDNYRYQAKQIELKVAFRFDLSETNNNIEENIREIIEQLRVGYRSIPASKVGFYGVETNLGVKSQWAEQRIAQKPEIKIQFAQSEQDRSMPWEEVQQGLTVTFQEVVRKESEDKKQLFVIYQSIIPEETFWKTVNPERGMAIELFVGREIPANKKPGEPLQRSPLIRCRHAIQLPVFNTPLPSTDPSPRQDSPLKDFDTGNTVNAIEKLPDLFLPLSYQNPCLIKGSADYPPIDTTDPVKPVKLAIEWQHLKKQADDYNPIAAYRLYRADAYSPTEYFRRDDIKALLVQPELTFLTIPLAMYQANPSTIEVLGRVVKDGKPKVLTDWQAQSLQDQAPLWQNTNPTTGAFTRLSTDLDSVLKYPSSPIWVLEAMADFILKMQSVLEALEPGDQQYRLVLQFHHPLEDRSPLALENEGVTLRERLDRLINNLNETIDPLGWWTLETLGLSCECHFEDAEGKRFDPQQLMKALRESLNGQEQPYPFSVVLFLAEDGKTYLNVFRLIYSGEIRRLEARLTILNSGDNSQKISNVKKSLDRNQVSNDLVDWLKDIKQLTQADTRVFIEIPGEEWRLYDSASQTTFFLQSQNTEFTIYEILREPWKIGDSVDFALSMGLRIKGRLDQKNEIEASLTPQDLDNLGGSSTLETWLAQIKARANASMPDGLLIPGRVIVYRYAGLSSETPEQKPLTSITLPIASNGLIHYELSVPDQWAHHCAIALEHLRRYDLVWQRLIEPTKIEPTEQLALNAREIPYNQLLFIRVDRTLPLVPHNVIALPCIGGIQSLVFVHPAAFAALASAVNATHGQYSGQHVFLERRINPDEKTKMLELYRKILSVQQWELYQAWMNTLEPIGSANPDHSPSLLDKASVALTEVPGTLAAIYGSDRYIYPDLPGYYEYCVAVYSTAGRVCSPIQTTSFISPIYDQPTLPKDKRQLEDEPRQQPQTVPCRKVSFNQDNNNLILKIRLIHYRNHLRDEIKPLWRNDEDNLNVGTDTEFEIDYGSLPDLYLTYQIYLRDNPEEENFAEPVLLPLAEIVPPLQKGNNPLPSSSFKCKTQLTGVKHVQNKETIIDLTIEQDSDNNGLEIGELYFQLSLNFSDPACTEALKKLRDYKPEQPELIAELIYLSVAREGVWSEIVTTTTPI